MKGNEKNLQEALQRLENSANEIIKTRGYNKDAKSLKILEELIREQLVHANTRSSTRTVR